MNTTLLKQAHKRAIGWREFRLNQYSTLRIVKLRGPAEITYDLAEQFFGWQAHWVHGIRKETAILLLKGAGYV